MKSGFEWRWEQVLDCGGKTMLKCCLLFVLPRSVNLMRINPITHFFFSYCSDSCKHPVAAHAARLAEKDEVTWKSTNCPVKSDLIWVKDGVLSPVKKHKEVTGRLGLFTRPCRREVVPNICSSLSPPAHRDKSHWFSNTTEEQPQTGRMWRGHILQTSGRLLHMQYFWTSGEVALHKQTVKNNNINQQQKDVSDRLHESYQNLCLFRTNVGPTWGLKGFRIITQTFSGFIALESIMSCFSLKHFYTSIQSCSRYTIMNISYSSSVLLILFI